ncbi:MAG: gliding motility-associated C-terminal domain-containing protein [Bacteroidetes bacterium]|nr:gliding motility-associated C-terminal domain-containing protein [Bacteroidota bacterium]MBU1718310.1 gliding motility-associated C-terminal domain-containing protein [Bacteroidota bacterium]
MKRGILILSFFLALCGFSRAQTFTITDTVLWSTYHQSLWGPGGPVYNLDQHINLVNVDYDDDFQVGDFWGGLGAAIIGQGDIFFSTDFHITGFTLGEVDVEYPVEIDLDFPADYSFLPGQWVTIHSGYDTIPGWMMDPDFPKFGKVFLTFDFEFNFDLDMVIGLGSGYDTTSILDFHVPPMHDSLIYFDSSGYVKYPCIDASGNFAICEGQLLPLEFDFPTIGLSGAITLPYCYNDDFFSDYCLFTRGDCTWIDLNINFLQILSSLAGLIPPPNGPMIQNIIDNLNGSFTYEEDFGAVVIEATINYTLLSLDMDIKSTMQHDVDFCPTVWTHFSFPTEVPYTITDPENGNAEMESGFSDTIALACPYDLNFKYPCENYPVWDIGLKHTITSGFTNHVWDSISFNFLITVIDIWIELLIDVDVLIAPITIVDETFHIGPLYQANIPLGYIPINWFNETWNLPGFHDSIFPGTRIIPDSTMQIDMTDSGVLCGDTTIDVEVFLGTPDYTYEWSTGFNETTPNTTSYIVVDSVGTYYVTVTDVNGCMRWDSCIVLGFAPEMFIAVSSDSVPCYGDSTGIVTVIAWGGTPAFHYFWSTGDFTDVVTGVPAGFHTVTVTDDAGCLEIDSIEVTQPDTGLYVITDSILHVFCFHGNNAFIETSVYGGTPGYAYSWTNGGSSSDIYDLIAGEYILTTTDTNQCLRRDTFMIVQPDSLIVFTHDDRICYGQTILLFVDSVTGGTQPYYYLWSSGDTITETTVQPFTDSTFTIVVSDSNHCVSNIGEAFVIVTPELIFSMNSHRDSICIGDSLIISADITGGGGPPYTVFLSNGDNGEVPFTVFPPNTMYYSATVTDTCGFYTAHDSIFVTVMPLPFVDFTSDRINGCPPLEVQYSDLNPESGRRYYWDFGNGTWGNISNSQTHAFYDTEGSYSVQMIVTDWFGCIDSIEKTDYIIVYSVPEANFSFSPDSILFTQDPSATFDFYNESGGSAFLQWDFGDNQAGQDNFSTSEMPQHSYNRPGVFTVMLIAYSSNNCTDTIWQEVPVIDDKIKVPGIITPNGDGYNDVFWVENIDKYQYSSLTIFNRWGRKVYEREPYQNTWNGKGLSDGVYFYILRYGHTAVVETVTGSIQKISQ